MNRKRIHKRIRATIQGTAATPRLAVFRSSKYIYAQLIDDAKAVTLCAASDVGQREAYEVGACKKIGEEIAKSERNRYHESRFDRGGFPYHGRIKAVADGAREGGLNIFKYGNATTKIRI